jgi:hypothetical protein
VLDQPLGLLDHHLGDLHVARRRLVKGRAYHLALHAALHVRDFFRALVDQQNDQHDLRMVGRDGVRDRLQQHRLAGARRSHDQPALALADRRQQVHHAARDVLADRLHLHPLLRVQRRQVVEQNLVARLFGRLEVDRLDLHQREVLLALMRRAHVAADGVAGLQVELANLRRRDVDVVRPGQVVVVRRAQEAVAVGQNLQHAFGEDVAFLFALRLQNLEDKVLLAEAAGAGNVKAAGQLAQLGDVVFFQLGNCHGYAQ